MASVYPRLGTYTWLVLTSVNGVRLFFKGLFESGLDIRALGHMKVARSGLQPQGAFGTGDPAGSCAGGILLCQPGSGAF